jgi:hypothetical protein
MKRTEMSDWAIGLITLICVYSGALLGLGLQRMLPKHHLNDPSKDAVKLVAGLLATLSALVLGLMVASAKSSFDEVGAALKQTATKVIVIDRLLAQYGPEAKDVRELLKRQYAERVERLFSTNQSDVVASSQIVPASTATEIFRRSVRGLQPTTEEQRAALARVQQLVEEVTETRWLAFEDAASSTPPPFLAVLILWLVMMFVSFGLFTPPNPTTFTALFFGAFAVATAIFIIEEMNHPLDGIIVVPSEPMRNALSVLGQ